MSLLYLYLCMIPTLAISLYGISTKKKTNEYLKVFALTLATIFFFRYMWAEDAIQEMMELGNTSIENKFLNVVALFLVWATLASNILLFIFPFFKIDWLNKYVAYFSFPVSILNIILFKIDLMAIVGDCNFGIRSMLFALEIGLAFSYSLTVFLRRKQFVANKTQVEATPIYRKKEGFKLFMDKVKTFFVKYWVFIFTGLMMAIATMPAYTIQGLFGYSKMSGTCKDFELQHRLLLYGAVVIPFIIYFSMRNRSFDERRFALMYICLGTLITFSLERRFELFLDPTRWPLHLCNTAMYIMPIVLIFKMKRFYYFTYFINVAGAFFAMFMPNYNEATNLFSSRLALFYCNHYIAFFMPILFIALGMFKKPKFKEFCYSLMGFAGYFILVLILNAVFTGLYEVGLASSKTDFFFINSDFIPDKLGTWAENLLNIKLVIPIGRINLTFLPIFQILFFTVYIFISLAMWFIYIQAFDISASLKDIKARSIDLELERYALEQRLNGRSFSQPVSMENVNKLILKDFSKKYSGSSRYSVKDANLEVNGGEIFGFLGPNGAGKSTIIKCIVGIQPITDGAIEVCGYDVQSQSLEAKSQIGYVPDHYALYEKLTGREYINYIADLFNVSLEDRNAIINDLVERFELQGSFDNQMKTYSHGMKQKMTIMAALVHNPKVWILDEPLTGLDPNSIYQVKECMKEHAKKGNIVFFSSHIIDVVEKICDKIAIIKKGDIKVCKSVKDIEKECSLEDFYMNVINGGEVANK